MAYQTKKQLAAGQRRTLAAMARKLRDMAAVWGDVDAYNESVLEVFAKEADEVSRNLYTEVEE